MVFRNTFGGSFVNISAIAKELTFVVMPQDNLCYVQRKCNSNGTNRKPGHVRLILTDIAFFDVSIRPSLIDSRGIRRG